MDDIETQGCTRKTCVTYQINIHNGDKYRNLHGGTSSSFKVKCGVRQGCILSPVLSVAVIGRIINTAILKHNANYNNSGIR